MKKCNKCKKWKDKSEFYKKKGNKDGLQGDCIKCKKQYEKERYEENKESKKQNQREYYKNNREKVLERNQEYKLKNEEWLKQWYKERYENDKERLSELAKENKLSPLKYNSKTKARYEIELYEEIKESTNGNVEVKCANCENWFEPTKRQTEKRLEAINGKLEGESKLYCSQECKDICPIYQQHKYPKHHKPYLDREVQPELTSMVLERDEYTCVKCQRHQSEIEVHCHHIEGVNWNPIESADMDNCTTLCKDCHREVHQEKGCTYGDMRCPN